ncbi:MAG TPA: ABC transporter permease [Myxococcales bacterium]|nr:ABC transporter permease [Myxococcales bacterium]
MSTTGPSASVARIASVAVKELRQLRRDRFTLAMMAALPLVQLTLFGYAIDTDVRHMSTVVLDQDHSARSRDFAQRMRATGFFDLVGEVDSYGQLERALRTGDAKVGLVVPARWSSDLQRGGAATLQLVVDGTDPQTVSSAVSAAGGLARAQSSDRALRRGGPPPAPQLTLEPVTWYNAEQRTSIFVVPGLIGLILTMTMVILTAMAIARERERGTLEQLIVSPLRPVELVVGKIVPYVGIGYLQMTLILLLGRLAFAVPLRGSLLLLYALAFVFIAANLALGLLFSTLAQTQQQAMQLSFFFLLPNFLLSGFMFPWEAMPKPAQWLSLALPLTHFLRIVRCIALKGGGLLDLRVELFWLVGLLFGLVLLASLRFRKKLA